MAAFSDVDERYVRGCSCSVLRGGVFAASAGHASVSQAVSRWLGTGRGLSSCYIHGAVMANKKQEMERTAGEDSSSHRADQADSVVG